MLKRPGELELLEEDKKKILFDFIDTYIFDFIDTYIRDAKARKANTL